MRVTRVAAKPLTPRPMMTTKSAASVLEPPKLPPVPVFGGSGACLVGEAVAPLTVPDG